LRLTIRPLLLLAVFLSPCIAFSQDSTSYIRPKIKYYNTLYSGGLIGESGLGTTTTFSFINGIRFKSLHLGVGLGYDSYLKNNDDLTGQPGTRWKVMPISASLGLDFMKVKANKVFVQFNAGFSQMWVSEKNNTLIELTDIKGGLMINPLVGYRISASKYSLYFATGYKWQKNEYNFHTLWWSGTEENQVNETMHRMVIQIGIGIH
jgi:hypothetical protein